jgi:hypothetical protein
MAAARADADAGLARGEFFTTSEDLVKLIGRPPTTAHQAVQIVAATIGSSWTRHATQALLPDRRQGVGTLEDERRPLSSSRHHASPAVHTVRTPAAALATERVPRPPEPPGESLLQAQAARVNPSDLAAVVKGLPPELPITAAV